MVSRRYRNRRIGDFLKELKLVEGRNTGIPTILHAMRQNGSDLPIFETDDERTYLTVILPVQRSFLNQKETETKSMRTKIRRNVLDIKKLILEILEQTGDIAASDIAKELGYAKINNTISKAVRELIEAGRIEYTEPEKPRSRNQKLRLTDSGRRA